MRKFESDPATEKDTAVEPKQTTQNLAELFKALYIYRFQPLPFLDKRTHD